MTDIEQLLKYRIDQATDTLNDAEKMLQAGLSARSIVNRSYYAMFYMTLALFLKSGLTINTSKHSGVIGIFDREFILTGKIDKAYSGMLHSLFDDRQEFDYKENVTVTHEDASAAVEKARVFIHCIIKFIERL